MSQEKVNKYKEEKANRKVIMKKEKRNKIITQVVGAVIGLALVGWIGYSVYDSVTDKIATAQTEVNLAAVTEYLNDLVAEDDADTAEDEADTAEDEADTAEE